MLRVEEEEAGSDGMKYVEVGAAKGRKGWRSLTVNYPTSEMEGRLRVGGLGRGLPSLLRDICMELWIRAC